MALMIRTILFYSMRDSEHHYLDHVCRVITCFVSAFFSIIALLDYKCFQEETGETGTRKKKNEPRTELHIGEKKNETETELQAAALESDSSARGITITDATCSGTRCSACQSFLYKIFDFFFIVTVVFCVSATDTQALLSERHHNDRLDMALGQVVGLISSTAMAVICGVFLQKSFDENKRILLLYMGVVFLVILLSHIQTFMLDAFEGGLPRNRLRKAHVESTISSS